MALTPENASDSLITKLSESEAEALAQAKIIEDYTRALKMLSNPETMLAKPVINLKRRYDLHYEQHPIAPPDERFSCVDLNTYDPTDGAPDHAWFIGRGPDRRAAMLALLDLFGEFDETPPKPRDRVVGLGNPFEPPTVIPGCVEDWERDDEC